MLRENMLKSLISAKGDPRLNVSLENCLCAILPEKVLLDAVLHSIHENQVASALSLVVSELCKCSAEAGIKNYAPGKMMRELFVKRIPSYFLRILTGTKMYFK